MRNSCQGLFFGFILTLVALNQNICLAQTELPETPSVTGFIETSYSHAFLTQKNSDWNDEYLRGNIQLAPGRNINAEISHQDHFDDDGTFFGLGYTHVFNSSWYGFLGAGTSSGGFFLPRYRVDALLYRKWLDKKNLVTSAGFTYFDAKSVYTDRTLLLGCMYYFDAPWILEVGGRLNESNPGHVRSNRGFIALTQGKQKQHYVTARYEVGQEAYQLVGNEALISNFSSYEASINWRQWVGARYGLLLRGTHYENPSYSRTSIEAGAFIDF